MPKKQGSNRRAPRITSPAWRAQNDVSARGDAIRAELRRRLQRFDDATLERLRALFTALGRVVALESPAADATIEALARTHDVFFPARAVLDVARPAERVVVALGPVRTACAELLRGGEAREHARFARFRLTELVDAAFAKLDVDRMARQLRSADPAKVLVKWNTDAGRPLGVLREKDVEAAQTALSKGAKRARRASSKASPRNRGSG